MTNNKCRIKSKGRRIIPVFSAVIFYIAISFPFASSFSQNIPREILAIYDSTDTYYNKPDYNLIHFTAEMPLNYLGMKVKYYDISKGMPTSEDMAGVRGIITFFADGSMPGAEDYCVWIGDQVQSGKKYLMLGNFGAFEDSNTGRQVPVEMVNKAYNSIGLNYGGEWTDNAFVINVVRKDSKVVEFERTLAGEVSSYEKVTPLEGMNVKSFLTLERTDKKNSESVAVAITEKGAFVMDGYAIELFPDMRSMWRIDPFFVFSKALDIENVPAYDTTTLFGRRLFYSHIDGDGLRNISKIDNKTFSGKIIKDEILDKIDLPVTASFIACEVDPKIFGNKELISLGRGIAALPNVECGVHGFSHPLDWDKMLTAFAVTGYSRVMTTEKDKDLAGESDYGLVAKVTVPWDQYIRKEIEGATDYLNKNILPAGKKVKVYQWTGNCEPPYDAVKMSYEIGVKNINGGDSMFDPLNPSYCGVEPLTRDIGGAIQFYTSNANENIYTNEWTGPFDGFRNVIYTFEQTERPTLINAPPRRVSPMNVYYHYYTGERKESLEALKQVYKYVAGQKITPVYTSEYLSIVEGFLEGKIKNRGEDIWEFTDYGDCRTVRISNAEKYPDMERSTGILGFKKWENFIYIHLACEDKAVLYLREGEPDSPYLVEAASVIKNTSIDPGNVSFETELFRESIYILKNMRKKTQYSVRAYEPGTGKLLYAERVRSSMRGNLSFVLDLKGKIKVEAVSE